MSLNMNTMRKKSNASKVQPRYAAITTLRWLLVHPIWLPQRENPGEAHTLSRTVRGGSNNDAVRFSKTHGTENLPCHRRGSLWSPFARANLDFSRPFFRPNSLAI